MRFRSSPRVRPVDQVEEGVGGLSDDPGAASAEPASEEFHDAGLWTIPNLISFLRLAAIPVFLWLLLARDDPRNAAFLLITIGWTDFLDGWLARKLGQTSEIGKFLDPVADRLAILAAVAGGLVAGVVPGWLGWPLLVREIIVGLGALYLVTRLKTNVAVRQMGKAATAIVYGSIPAFYVAAADIEPDFWKVVGALSGTVGLLLYVAVTGQYVGDVRKALRQRAAPAS